tara:strand:- start:751 stop:1317 length:567 start_codon:yes stop_codon:yes gene_type:complete
MESNLRKFNCRFVPPRKRAWRKYNFKKLIKKYFSDCESILDVGAGDCMFEECCEELGKNVLGIDLNPKFKRKNIIIKDFRNVTEKYEGVFVGGLLYAVNQFELIETISRICTKRCVIVECMPNDRGLWNTPTAIRPWSKRSVMGLFNNYSSLRVVDSGYFIPYCFFLSKNKHYVVAEPESKSIAKNTD